MPSSEPLDLAPATILFRRLFPGTWADGPDRPFSNSFELRSGETGLSFYRAEFCTEAQVLAAGPPGSGIVAFVYEELSGCLEAFESDPDPDPGLITAHLELRLRGAPLGKQIPGGKGRLLAKWAAPLRKPDPKRDS